MPLDADQVIVGAYGNIFVAPKDTALPADYDAAVTAITSEAVFKSLGYVDENGISFTSGKESTDIFSWQSADPIRSLLTKRTGSFTAALMQINEETLPFALGGGTWTQGSGDEFVYEFPLASDAQDERTMLVDVEDGDNQIILGFYRALVSGDTTTNWVRGQAATLPLTVSLLAGSPGNIGRIVGNVAVSGS